MEVGERYVEQLQTTVETMRRRCIAFYDLSVRMSKRSTALVERAREVGEPALADLYDHVALSCAETTPLDAEDRETRNTLVELYLGNLHRVCKYRNDHFFLGISLILIGTCSGQLSGVTLAPLLLGRVLDAWAALLLVVALPAHVYLSFRKNAGKKRVKKCLYALIFCSPNFSAWRNGTTRLALWFGVC